MQLTQKTIKAMKKLNNEIIKLKRDKWSIDIAISKIEQKKIDIVYQQKTLRSTL